MISLLVSTAFVTWNFHLYFCAIFSWQWVAISTKKVLWTSLFSFLRHFGKKITSARIKRMVAQRGARTHDPEIKSLFSFLLHLGKVIKISQTKQFMNIFDWNFIKRRVAQRGARTYDPDIASCSNDLASQAICLQSKMYKNNQSLSPKNLAPKINMTSQFIKDLRI